MTTPQDPQQPPAGATPSAPQQGSPQPQPYPEGQTHSQDQSYPHGQVQPGQPPSGAPFQQPSSFPQQGQQPSFPQQGPAHSASDPAAENRKKKTRLISAIASIVILVGVGIIVFISQQGKASNAEVGECVHVIDSSSTKPKVDAVACTERTAEYVVVRVGDNLACNPSYSEGDKTLCLRPNLATGDCFKEGSKAANGVLEKIDCSAADADGVKVTDIKTNSTDEKDCPEGSVGQAFEEAQYVYCFAAAKS